MIWYVLALLGVGLAATQGPKLVRGATEGDDAPEPPTHGRTARLKYKGMPKWLDVMGKIQRGVTKAIVTAFSGGTAAKAWGWAQDKLMASAGKLRGKAWATWINNATNEEVAALRLGKLRKMVAKERGKKKSKFVPLYDRLGLTNEVLEGPLPAALRAAFRTELCIYGAIPFLPPQETLHNLQAMAILLWGPRVLPLLDEWLAEKPKGNPQSLKGLDVLLPWADDAIRELDTSGSRS